MKNIILAFLLAGPVSAQVVNQTVPSPNSGTITPSAITTGVGSFSGSVTASSVTSQGGVLAKGAVELDYANPAYNMQGQSILSRNSGTGAITVKTGDTSWPLGLQTAGGSVGIGTASPGTTLDVNGNAQFGSGATKSTFTATGFWEPYSRTKAQIDLLVPTKVGQVIYASDTTLPGLCVSTGTLAAQWRKMESATLGCGTNN